MVLVTMGTVKERFLSIASHCVYTTEMMFFWVKEAMKAFQGKG